MPLSLNKKTIIGEHAWHLFSRFYIDDAGKIIWTGSPITVPCSLEEYTALGMKGAVAPLAPEGYAWKISVRDNKFDTPSGFLEDGQYAEENGKYVVKLAGFKGRVSVPLQSIVNDIISDEGIERVEKLHQ